MVDLGPYSSPLVGSQQAKHRSCSNAVLSTPVYPKASLAPSSSRVGPVVSHSPESNVCSSSALSATGKKSHENSPSDTLGKLAPCSVQLEPNHFP